MFIQKKMEKNKIPFGFLLVDKSSNPTSFDIVYQLRKITGIKKIGHAGTLDPFASGLLIVAIGKEATKKISQFVKLDKKYEAEIILGAESNTYDRTGILTKKKEITEINKKDIIKILKKIKKSKEQIPPMYSAKKIGGKKLYQLARKNIEIERPAQLIKISKIKIIDYSWPKIKLKIACSSGTYIRSIANDLGKELACGAYLNELRRTKIGKYRVKKAKKIENINSENWIKYIFNTHL